MPKNTHVITHIFRVINYFFTFLKCKLYLELLGFYNKIKKIEVTPFLHKDDESNRL